MRELYEKLAEWAGFKEKEGETYGWNYPDGSWRRYLPDFPNDLNACFKWLVLKLKEKLRGGFELKMVWGRMPEAYKDDYGIVIDGFLLQTHERFYAYEHDKTPAQALCLAIDKLIDSEVKE